MTTVRAGRRPLTADEAALLLGAGPDRVTFLRDLGFLTPLDTPGGQMYRHDEVLALRDAIGTEPPQASQQITAAQAAYILGVGAQTVRRAAEDGYLTRDARGRYGSAEVRALHASRRGRKPLRPAPPETD